MRNFFYLWNKNFLIHVYYLQKKWKNIGKTFLFSLKSTVRTEALYQ